MYPKDYFSQPVQIVPGSCFVLMPFDPTMRPVYETISEAVEEVAFTCQRADELFGGGQIIKDVLKGIGSAELVIADVTSRNPNVFYELGVAHTTKPIEKVIIIAQSMDDVPFDLRQFRYLVYSPSPEGLQQLKTTLIETVRSVSGRDFRFTVADGSQYVFPHKLLGEDNFLYNFKMLAYSGYNAAKFEILVLRHSTTHRDEEIDRRTFALSVGHSTAVPYLPWELHLDRIVNGTLYFRVSPKPDDRIPRAPSTRAGGHTEDPPIELPATRVAKLEGYELRQLESRTIEVYRDGVPVVPAKPALRELAERLQINIYNRNGNPLNTRQLGSEIIDRLLRP